MQELLSKVSGQVGVLIGLAIAVLTLIVAMLAPFIPPMLAASADVSISVKSEFYSHPPELREMLHEYGRIERGQRYTVLELGHIRSLSIVSIENEGNKTAKNIHFQLDTSSALYVSIPEEYQDSLTIKGGTISIGDLGAGKSLTFRVWAPYSPIKSQSSGDRQVKAYSDTGRLEIDFNEPINNPVLRFVDRHGFAIFMLSILIFWIIHKIPNLPKRTADKPDQKEEESE